jgi:hypothetical protein
MMMAMRGAGVTPLALGDGEAAGEATGETEGAGLGDSTTATCFAGLCEVK